MRLLDRINGGGSPERGISTIDEYAELLNQFSFNGFEYGFGLSNGVQQTLKGSTTEMAPNNFVGLASHAYLANGVVFACMLVRMLVFSSIRFRWQNVANGKPSDMFGTAELQALERPWVGGTTQDMLVRTIQDADLAGNAYWFRETSLARLGTQDPGGEMVRMRPDWIDVVLGERQLSDGRGQIGWRKAGYVYTEGGFQSGNDPVGLLADEVAHFAPIPDPLANYRGMSWLTPILREIQADQAMTRHQRAFFDNGATVNMVIKHPTGATQDAVAKWEKEFTAKFAGARNAYKTLQIYPGADVTPVGSNLKDIDFKDVRGGGETRVAAAAGVPPVIVGLSEGLAAATYSNYGQARRRLADGTAHPLWQNLAGSLENVLKRPPGGGSRLWYDASDVPFLREDEKDAAEIQKTRAETISTLITAGYEPESVIKAVESGDLRLLKHSGLTSVQLLPPGTSASGSPDTPTDGGSDDDSGE
ncbi:phage portal protein [Mycobacterium adipatum]|uniref:phage portal protein n=1 Tax=Mycobacterium adipatum TaxID=1682113 RepID=UPI0034E0C614